MKTLKKDFDFKGFFFFIISLGSLLLLFYILYHEIKALKQNISQQESKIEIKQKEVIPVIQNTYTSEEKARSSTIEERKEEKRIIIKVGVFKNKKNLDNIISMLKKEKYDYKVKGNGIYKVYVFARSEREKEKIISLLKKKNIKPIIVRDIEG